MTRCFFTFSTVALATIVLCTPGVAQALKYRIGPGTGCKVLAFPAVLSQAWNCAVPTGTEFLPTNISVAQVDIYSSSSTQTSVQTCRQAWNSSTLTCSSYTSATASGVQHIFASPTPFTAMSNYDYRYYHIESNGTKLLGVYTSNTDT